MFYKGVGRDIGLMLGQCWDTVCCINMLWSSFGWVVRGIAAISGSRQP